MDRAPFNRPEYDSRTDAELWTALCGGDNTALGQLYDRHAGSVYGISSSMLGNAQEAEDLTQDIFVKLVKDKKYDPARGSLRTFLMMLTRSRALDRLRSRKSARRSQQRLQLNYAASLRESSDPATQSVIENEQSEIVKVALSQLSTEQQQALRLAYYEGYTQSDIAAHLNIPLGTIKARTRRGLLKLRSVLNVQKETPKQESTQSKSALERNAPEENIEDGDAPSKAAPGNIES